ncbi:expressed unknown protein [Seminavis robusta]|uniref:Uncharacterized protein n=1 Tax=Seminavis robusta TaxID=568900 RepID=A0A9N8E0W9_9STRA|nr:expressed unknown protein [Seminavis robusta]|eukprot:Sro437_g142880.1 n/a (285) ;mRNA; r:50065-50919
MVMSISTRSAFHFDEENHRLDNGGDAREIMLRSKDFPSSPRNRQKVSVFNDWSFYQELRQQPGCLQVELSQLHVEHSSWFLTGIQATYQCTFADGTVVEANAPFHEFQRFRYRHYRSNSRRSTLKLQLNSSNNNNNNIGEYIINIAFRRVDKITDRVAIQTNVRTVHYGSPDFSCFPPKWLLPRYQEDDDNNHARKIVALGGIASVLSEQIGCFSESQHWMRLKDWILVRTLVEQGRARPIVDKNATSQQQVVKALVQDINRDVFQQVLSFLIPSNPTNKPTTS